MFRRPTPVMNDFSLKEKVDLVFRRGIALVNKFSTNPTTELFDCQRRFQSNGADKKFHCSVCKKSFRLEMAAKVHIQQAHNGDGTVETGVGPGQQASDPTPPVRNVPPVAPVKLSEIQTEEKRPTKRSRPTPKPLHEPDRSIPTASMEEMLKVWDDVGVKRLGAKFIHSSMIMKVFAAKPSDGGDSIYDKVIQRGVNPFSSSQFNFQLAQAQISECADQSCAVNISHPFALSTSSYIYSFRPGEIESPIGQNRLSPEFATSSVDAPTSGSNDGSAPVTPFGQLPVFGQVLDTIPNGAQEAGDTIGAAQSSTASTTVASPFGGDSAKSPFAAAVSTPFSSSPFAAMSDVATVEPSASPFNSSALSSPFTSADGVPSPFTSSPDSPFSTAAEDFSTSTPSSLSNFPSDSSTAFNDQHSGFKCKHCDRNFASHMALRMHSKAKHNLSLPSSPRSKEAPDLPAYIPSPVNLSMTSPFCTVTSAHAWPETELHVFTQAMSNMTLIGKVQEVEQIGQEVSQILLWIQGDKDDESGTIPIQCYGTCHQIVEGTIKQNDKIFVCGSLRLFPVYEPTNKKYYSCPVVHVTLPTGTIAKIH